MYTYIYIQKLSKFVKKIPRERPGFLGRNKLGERTDFLAAATETGRQWNRVFSIHGNDRRIL